MKEPITISGSTTILRIGVIFPGGYKGDLEVG